jgi:hypothetical protein
MVSSCMWQFNQTATGGNALEIATQISLGVPTPSEVIKSHMVSPWICQLAR